MQAQGSHCTSLSLDSVAFHLCLSFPTWKTGMPALSHGLDGDKIPSGCKGPSPHLAWSKLCGNVSCVFLLHALFYMENSAAWVLGNEEGRVCWEAADFSISCISVEEPRGRGHPASLGESSDLQPLAFLQSPSRVQRGRS